MPPTSHCLCALAASALIVACAPAHAEDDVPRLRLSGFGTLGATYHGSDGLEYRRSLDQAGGSRGGHLEFGVDSIIGAQINARLSDQFDAVLQAVSGRRPDNTWDPDISWAFLRFSPDESLQLRVGRVGTEPQLNGDSRLIGYSYLPVRLSPELFGTAPQDHLDGFDIAYRHPVGDWLLSVKGFAGYQTVHVNSAGRNVRVPSNDVAGLIFGAMFDDVQVRFVTGVAHTKNNGDAQAIVDGLRATGMPQAVAAARRLDNSDRLVRFGAADIGYEHGPLRLIGSVFWQTVPDDAALLVDTRSAALVAGYRVNAFTPYFTAGRATTSGVTFATGLPAGPALTPLDQAATGAVNGAQFSQRSFGLGVRWDFATDRALKLQVDRVHVGQSPLVRDTRAAPQDAIALTLVSATLDFVF